MIELLTYDPAWPLQFSAEAQRLRAALGALALRIEHVGSTAVPGLVAKPVIDIQVSVASLAPRGWLEAPLRALGYTHLDLGDFDRVYPFFHRPALWPHTQHVHACVAGSEEERRHLAFRDWLRRHADGVIAYADLKRGLAVLHPGHDAAERERYSLAKSAFVEAAIVEAFSEGLPAPGSA